MKENKKRHRYKGDYLEKSNARRKYKDAPENRLRRGHQQREANHKGSEKEEELNRVLSAFSLTLRPRKTQTSLFNHCTFQRCVFMLPTRFVRTSRNGSTVSENMEPLSLLSTSRGILTARVMMNIMLAIRYFFPDAGN